MIEKDSRNTPLDSKLVLNTGQSDPGSSPETSSSDARIRLELLAEKVPDWNNARLTSFIVTDHLNEDLKRILAPKVFRELAARLQVNENMPSLIRKVYSSIMRANQGELAKKEGIACIEDPTSWKAKLTFGSKVSIKMISIDVLRKRIVDLLLEIADKTEKGEILEPGKFFYISDEVGTYLEDPLRYKKTER